MSFSLFRVRPRALRLSLEHAGKTLAETFGTYLRATLGLSWSDWVVVWVCLRAPTRTFWCVHVRLVVVMGSIFRFGIEMRPGVVPVPFAEARQFCFRTGCVYSANALHENGPK